MDQYEPSRTRRKPTPPGHPVDERSRFFGRRHFEQSREPLCILDFEATIKDVNQAWERSLAHHREEVLGRPSIELVHPDDRSATLEQVANLAHGRDETAKFENRYRGTTGEWVWLEWSARVVPR